MKKNQHLSNIQRIKLKQTTVNASFTRSKAFVMNNSKPRRYKLKLSEIQVLSFHGPVWTVLCNGYCDKRCILWPGKLVTYMRGTKLLHSLPWKKVNRQRDPIAD